MKTHLPRPLITATTATTVTAAAIASLQPFSHTALRANTHTPPSRPNVLFIASDDLKPLLGCYGDPIARTPNIDRLAARGIVFQRAYCQQAVCSPTRTSLLTSRRPDNTKVYDLVTHFRDTIPDAVTLPQYFKQHGYTTQSYGKIFHGNLDDPRSWTIQKTFKAASRYGPNTTPPPKGVNNRGKAKGGLPWEAPDVPDAMLTDGSVAREAAKTLAALGKDSRENNKPFFLAVGFLVPHLPFVAPKKYWDLFRDEDIRLPRNYRTQVTNVTPYSGTTWGELRNYIGIPAEGPLSDAQARSMIHGYYACVSYLDAQIGLLLDTLERENLARNTVIILWGDHGWHLGDHGQWTKHTNFEQAAHVPLIISAPAAAKTAGRKTRALVEFLDIYPTLAQLCALPPPPEVEGTSLVPLIEDPEREWNRAAYSQYPRSGGVMGYSMRTDRYRYTAWYGPRGTLAAQELYDHQTDDDEDHNIAGAPEHAALVKQMREHLETKFPAATKPRGARSEAGAAKGKKQGKGSSKKKG